jgi:hypothetical protein
VPVISQPTKNEQFFDLLPQILFTRANRHRDANSDDELHHPRGDVQLCPAEERRQRPGDVRLKRWRMP